MLLLSFGQEYARSIGAEFETGFLRGSAEKAKKSRWTCVSGFWEALPSVQAYWDGINHQINQASTPIISPNLRIL